MWKSLGIVAWYCGVCRDRFVYFFFLDIEFCFSSVNVNEQHSHIYIIYAQRRFCWWIHGSLPASNNLFIVGIFPTFVAFRFTTSSNQKRRFFLLFGLFFTYHFFSLHWMCNVPSVLEKSFSDIFVASPVMWSGRMLQENSMSFWLIAATDKIIHLGRYIGIKVVILNEKEITRTQFSNEVRMNGRKTKRPKPPTKK